MFSACPNAYAGLKRRKGQLRSLCHMVVFNTWKRDLVHSTFSREGATRDEAGCRSLKIRVGVVQLD